MTTHSRVRALDDAIETAEFGGKASSLASLKHAGLRVPAAVCLSSHAYLEAARATIATPSIEPDPDHMAAALLTSRPPDELVAELLRRLATEGVTSEDSLIVRSSAVGEDSDERSFAGQLESVSDVSVDHRAVAEAIAAVWASAWGPRARLYRERHGLQSIEALPVGVVVQLFIEPASAGVMFTAPPTGTGDDLLIEVVAGRGEGLVSGQVDPARYRVPRGNPAAPEMDGPVDFALEASTLAELVSVGLGIERAMGSPQDVEWLVSDGQLFVVQARPITTSDGRGMLAPDETTVDLVIVSHENRRMLPADLADKDKFRLRLIATEAGVGISRGWLVTSAEPAAGASLPDCSAAIRDQSEVANQVSIVLQSPSRLDGEILRQFSPLAELERHLSRVVGRVLAAGIEEFGFIVTEIYSAEKSGIAHIVNGQLVAEVAFGSYVPKGIVPTSLYVAHRDGEVEIHNPVHQEKAVFIEAGSPVTRSVERVASLDMSQLQQIWKLTEAVSDHYPDVSVEFGVLASGEPYLIDIIPDMAPVNVADVRVMSPGVITGRVVVVDSEDLLERSLDAHFHSERGSSGDAEVGESVVVVAPTPFLALEEYMAKHGAKGLGFVFQSGSLLGHLAIILREHEVPAIIVPDVKSLLTGGEVVTIDSSSESLLDVERS